MKRILQCILMLCFCVLHAQQQISLTVDNDLLAFSDRNYTSGIFLEYEKALSQNFIFTKEENNSVQLNFRLGQEIYAPEELDAVEKEKLDRPFAGWLFLNTTVHQISDKNKWSVGIDVGFTGKYSFCKRSTAVVSRVSKY